MRDPSFNSEAGPNFIPVAYLQPEDNFHGKVHSSSALQSVNWRFIVLFALAYTGWWMAVMPPIMVSLALKVNSIVGVHRGAEEVGMMLGAAALIAMTTTVFFGKLSDRTRSSFGMRRPWMLLGAIGGLAGSVICGFSHTIPVLMLGVAIVQLSYSATGAVLVAVLPDQVPPRQQGLVSGVIGLTCPLGMMAGIAVVQAVGKNEVAMFVASPVVALVAVTCFVLTLNDRKLGPAPLSAWSTREILSSFYVSPQQHPDFAWAWVSRFLIGLALAALTTYQAFYLLEDLKASPNDLAKLILYSTSVLCVANVVSSALAGKISDLLARRKVFVTVSAVALGVAFFMIARATTVPEFLVAMGVGGFAWGVYSAVDLALVAAVLPSRDAVGNLMGVFNVAATLPQIIAPAVAPMILVASNHSYGVLYGVAGAFAVASAVAVMCVRGVR